MKLRLDPWPADYNSPLAFDEAESPAGVDVDASVETATWAAIPVQPISAPPKLCFVDGVRRVEARVLGEDNGSLVHGLFASLASGFVEACDHEARFGEIRIERFLILGKGAAQARAVNI